jgi:hypothetical protein
MIKFFAALPPNYIKEDLPEGNYLVSAGSWWDGKKLRLPKHIPMGEYYHYMIDSGGFNFKDTGECPFTFQEYVEWAAHFNPDTVVAPDSFADAPRTLAFFHVYTNTLLYFKKCNWQTTFVLTGKTEDDYKWLLKEISRHYVVDKWAIGGLKKRKIDVADIVDWVRCVTPEASIHLFGYGVGSWNKLDPKTKKEITSIDSGSWNGRFASGITEFNQIMKEKQLTQREVALQYMLPRYIERFEEVK